MERELVELFEAVKKAADAAAADGVEDSSPEEDRCLDALKLLKKFPVNYHLLVVTQVGKRLRHLTKHPRSKIQDLASQLIAVWKDVIIEETLKDKKNGSSGNKDLIKAEPAGTETSSSKKVQRVNSMKVEKAETVWVEKNYERANSVKVDKVETAKIEKNDRSGTIKSEKAIKSETPSNLDVVKTEKKIIKEEKQTSDFKKPTTTNVAPPKLTSNISCKDPLRDKVRELLSEALNKVASEVDDDQRDEANACDPFRVAVSLESAMYEKWGRSNGAQKFKYRSIMFNVKDPHNPDFRRKILFGHVQPQRVLEMTPEEMASTERQLENIKIKEKALFDCERGGPATATTDQFKCGRCGKRKCTYYQMQTRSADEPMTTYVTCVNCDNHWKFC